MIGGPAHRRMLTMTAVSRAALLHDDPHASTGPLHIELRFTLSLPPEKVFDLVANRLPEWFSAIHAVSWDHSRSTHGAQQAGACSERSCDFGGKKLKEVMVSWEQGRRYSYRADLANSTMKMPLSNHLGSFELEPVAEGTQVTWRQYFTPAWFMPGAMLRWQMRERMMKPAVEKLMAVHGGRWR